MSPRENPLDFRYRREPNVPTRPRGTSLTWYHTGFGILLVASVVLSLYGISDTANSAENQSKSYKETSIGSVPTEFGELVGFASDDHKTTQTFENTSGVIRLIELRGNELQEVAYRIDRVQPARPREGAVSSDLIFSSLRDVEKISQSLLESLPDQATKSVSKEIEKKYIALLSPLVEARAKDPRLQGVVWTTVFKGAKKKLTFIRLYQYLTVLQTELVALL